jgi:hypothetical protein
MNLKVYPMDIDPEELKELLNQTWAEWYADANTAPLPIGFPPEVITKLENIFGTYPSWDLIDAAVERVHSDKRLEKTFVADLQRLMDDEDSFQWPIEDPHYCLVLGLLRDYGKRFLAKLSQDEDQDEEDEDQDKEGDEPDPVDWWKETQ